MIARRLLLVPLLVLGCRPPTPGGGLTCALDRDCPDGWCCAAGTCDEGPCADAGVDPPDAGCAAGCDDGFYCGTAGTCVHVCAYAPGDCPVGMGCGPSGCAGAPCDGCGSGETCASGECLRQCTGATACPEGTSCQGGLCRRLLATAERIDAIASLAGARCAGGVNGGFEEGTLEGWCVHAVERDGVPEPRVTTSAAIPLRAVIMGRAATGVPLDGNRVVSLSLAQVHPLTDALLDQSVVWDFFAAGGGPGWGAALSLAFVGSGRTPGRTYVRSFSPERTAAPPEVGFGNYLAEGPVHHPASSPPPLSIRAARDAVAEGTATYDRVAVVLTIWTSEPRVELQHHALRVVPTAP